MIKFASRLVRASSIGSGRAAVALLAVVCMHASSVPAAEARLNVLSPRNLAMPRPAAPFNLTGSWKLAMSGPNSGYLFDPVPALTPVAQKEYDAMLKAKSEGKEYRDDAADCYPPGMPRFMTRVWPTMVVQLPTAVLLIQGFERKARWIFTDGREHTPYDVMVPSFDGESIGRWERDSLVAETKGLRADHHWMQPGVPISEELKIVERFRMLPAGDAFEVDFTFTDPVNWKGEWKSTKRYLRVEEEVIGNECIYADMQQLPSSSVNQR